MTTTGMSGAALRGHAVRLYLAVASLLLVLVLTGLGVHWSRDALPGLVRESGPATVERPFARTAITRHVILISVDGLRPDAIVRSGSTVMGRLLRTGSYTLRARTILPSSTLPSHASMVSGVEPSSHGITWNDDSVDAEDVPDIVTIFDLASEAGLTTAAFFGKAKLRQLVSPGEADLVEAPHRWAWTSRKAERTINEIREYLEAGEHPNLLFVHIGEPDWAGHEYGWLSDPYAAAVNEADEAIGDLLTLLNQELGAGTYTLILTADHGGSGRGHGDASPESSTIPWITWGKGVRVGQQLSVPVRTTDTAATAAWLLGLEIPREWVGRPVVAAYAEGRTAAARPPS